MKTTKRPSWVLIYIFICVVLNFVPYLGSPNFRYTGADPTVDVLNFGWPLASLIYDFRYGLQGELILIIPKLFLQIFLFGLIFIILTVARKIIKLKKHEDTKEQI